MNVWPLPFACGTPFQVGICGCAISADGSTIPLNPISTTLTSTSCWSRRSVPGARLASGGSAAACAVRGPVIQGPAASSNNATSTAQRLYMGLLSFCDGDSAAGGKAAVPVSPSPGRLSVPETIAQLLQCSSIGGRTHSARRQSGENFVRAETSVGKRKPAREVVGLIEDALT